MSSLKSLILFGFIAVVGFASAAKADVFVWKDAGGDISLAFPDRWAIVNNHMNDEILRIAAPEMTDRYEDAQCRYRVRDDNRFQMHPVSHSRAIQRVHFSTEFWKDYAAEFKGASINSVTDNAGMGQGFASFADISFEAQAGKKVVRRALAFATLYKNQVHIFECSAQEDAYSFWHNSFLGILKSIDFEKRHAIYDQGFYRNFYGGKTVIKGQTELDDYTF